MPLKVLLTGVTGFICSNLAVYLVNKYQDYYFIGIDKNSYCSSQENIREIKNYSNFDFIKLDLTDHDDVFDLFNTHQFDWIIHLASYSHVDLSFNDATSFFHNNVIGTLNLLEAVKVHSTKLFIHMSTDEVYGSKDGISSEISALDPTNPYSASKAAAEHLVMSYHHSFNVPVIILRSNNIYGPKQFPEKVIPKFIMRLLKGNQCEIQGDGLQQRSFIHVDDFNRAMNKLIKYGEKGQIYNLGSEYDITIKSLAKLLCKLVSNEYVKEELCYSHIADRKFNDKKYNISCDKIKSLGWKERVDFIEGLKELIEWYKENLNFWNEEQLSIIN
jgi:dTDP-glucose 4,6-dehydratase